MQEKRSKNMPSSIYSDRIELNSSILHYVYGTLTGGLIQSRTFATIGGWWKKVSLSWSETSETFDIDTVCCVWTFRKYVTRLAPTYNVCMSTNWFQSASALWPGVLELSRNNRQADETLMPKSQHATCVYAQHQQLQPSMMSSICVTFISHIMTMSASSSKAILSEFFYVHVFIYREESRMILLCIGVRKRKEK